MTTEQQTNVMFKDVPVYRERPRLKVLHIYERTKPDLYWKTVLVETVYENTQISNVIIQ